MMTEATALVGEVTTEVTACLCGETSVSRQLVSRDEITGALFIYLRCANCGLERLCPRPVLGEMWRYYPNNYAPYEPPADRGSSPVERLKHLLYLIYWATPAERPALVRRFRWLLMILLAPLSRHSVLSFVPPVERRVFEFGAGSGGNLIDFRAAGWEVTGCEPSAHACQVAAHQGIILQNCAAEEAHVPSGMTCVYMNNVFEHLHDPPTVLAKSRAALLSDGLLVLIVPNHDSWSARLFGAAWPGYDPPRHIWGYTPSAIRMLLQDAGFDVLSVSQRFPLSDYCWFSGMNGYRAPSVAWRAARARMARLVRRLLIPAGALAALCGHGDYIHVVARKLGHS